MSTADTNYEFELFISSGQLEALEFACDLAARLCNLEISAVITALDDWQRQGIIFPEKYRQIIETLSTIQSSLVREKQSIDIDIHADLIERIKVFRTLRDTLKYYEKGGSRNKPPINQSSYEPAPIILPISRT